MASLRKNTNPLNDTSTAKFLYAILKQLDHKSIDWPLVASELGITNGHAARMRFSRFKQHMEGGTSTTRRPRASGATTRTNKMEKRHKLDSKKSKGKATADSEEGISEDDAPDLDVSDSTKGKRPSRTSAIKRRSSIKAEFDEEADGMYYNEQERASFTLDTGFHPQEEDKSLHSTASMYLDGQTDVVMEEGEPKIKFEPMVKEEHDPEFFLTSFRRP